MLRELLKVGSTNDTNLIREYRALIEVQQRPKSLLNGDLTTGTTEIPHAQGSLLLSANALSVFL